LDEKQRQQQLELFLLRAAPEEGGEGGDEQIQ